MLQEIAAENEVSDRLRIGGECEPGTLEGVLRASDADQGALIVCDCEGCETAVLDPSAAPSLAGASLLIECHDLIHEGITSTLQRRFEPTHDLELISTRPRWICEHPELSFLPVVTQIMAIHEFREGPMHWLVARPRWPASSARRAQPGGAWSGWGMQSSSSSATTMRSRFSHVISLAGSLRTLNSRKLCSSES